MPLPDSTVKPGAADQFEFRIAISSRPLSLPRLGGSMQTDELQLSVIPF